MDPGDLRVSDQDRELAAAALRTHFAVGRLDTEELDERVSAAYAAKTRSQLDATLVQLPVLPPSVVEQRVALTERRRVLRGRALGEVGAGSGTAVLTVVIWAGTGGGYFWPIWVIIAMLLPLLKGGWDLYSPWGDLDRVEAELNRKARSSAGEQPALPSGDALRGPEHPTARDSGPADRREAV